MQVGSVCLTKPEIQEAFEKAKGWLLDKFKEDNFSLFIDEPKLQIIDDKNEGWDIRNYPAQRKIVLNLHRVRWYLERERIIKHCPKYDLECAFIHDLFEYCYFRKWDYDPADQAVISIVHHRACILENLARRKKGLGDWI